MTQEDYKTLQELHDKGIYISVAPCHATEEYPYRWVVNKKQNGSWGGCATFYAPEKSGDASTHDAALKRAIEWTLENLI